MERQHEKAPRSRRLERLARGLGWFGIGLGLVELIAPRALARASGLEGRERVLQLYGLREVATGVGILAAKDPTPWVWARVAGDALDGATLAAGLDEDNPERVNAVAALVAVAPVVLLDVLCARALSETTREPARQYEYGDRSGFPLPASEMRGAALQDFEPPRDMRTPAALAPGHLH